MNQMEFFAALRALAKQLESADYSGEGEYALGHDAGQNSAGESLGALLDEYGVAS